MSKRVAILNFLETITSFLRHDSTVARQWQLPDRSGEISVDFVDAATGAAKNSYLPLGAISCTSPTTGAATINSIRVTAWNNYSTKTIDSLIYEVTAGTTGNLRLVIFKDDGTGYPGELAYDSGDQAIAAPGAFTIAVANLVLPPGLYWIGYITNTANTFRVVGFGNTPNVTGMGAAIGATFENAYAATFTYAAAPATYPAGASLVQINRPVIGARFV